MRLIVLLLLSCLTACGGSPSRPPRSSGSASAATTSHTATPTAPRTGPLTTGPNVRPGEKPPKYPADAGEHNASGALSFAIYYVAALDWSAATNDTYLLERISAPDCAACVRNIDAARQLRVKNETQVGGRSRILDARVVHGTFKIKSDQVIQVTTDDDAIVIASGSGERSTAAPADRGRISYVFVSWREGRWIVVGEGAPS